MADSITIHELAVWTKIGTTDVERSVEQQLLVTLEMSCPLAKAGASDSIGDTINYDDVAQDIQQLARTERKLLERFCEEIAELVLTKYKAATVRVSIAKFALPDAARVTVTVNRP